LDCARGEMENVLKHPVLDLPADKLSTHFLASNQLRLWLASFADQLLDRLRTLGWQGTELARATARTGSTRRAACLRAVRGRSWRGRRRGRATAGSLRWKLLKVAAQATLGGRRGCIQFSITYLRPDLFRLGHARLMQLAPADG
jgi:Transposase DDE domain group 1